MSQLILTLVLSPCTQLPADDAASDGGLRWLQTIGDRGYAHAKLMDHDGRLDSFSLYKKKAPA